MARPVPGVPLAQAIYDEAGVLLVRKGFLLTPQLCGLLEGRGVTLRPFVMLRILGEASDTEPFRLHGICHLGRSKDSTIVLADSSISSRHCRVAFREDGLTVEDLKSTNGTFINDVRTTGETVLSQGDILKLGEREFLVEIAAEVSIETGFESVKQETIDLGLGVQNLSDPTISLE